MFPDAFPAKDFFGDSFFAGRKIQTDWEMDHMLGVDVEQQKARWIMKQQEREQKQAQSQHRRRSMEWER